MRLVLGSLLCLCAVLNAGDAASRHDDPNCGCTQVIPPQTLTLQAVSSNNFRFRDFLGQDFSAAFVQSYSYATANVQLGLSDTTSGYLLITVDATGLKPNFAYQIKLSGRPSEGATNEVELANADDHTNEHLGRLGRWWRASPNPSNSNDADYDLYKNTDGYIYQGYLIVGFFVTDAEGKAQKTIEGNNSFHVLWRTDQRLPTLNDGPASAHSIPATNGNAAYGVDLAERSTSLYGEIEPTRATPGNMKMDQFLYKCDLQLTEESFHEGGALAGQWPVAMSAPVTFSILRPDLSHSAPVVSPLSIETLKSSLDLVHGDRDSATLLIHFTLPEDFPLADVTAQVTLMGVTRNFTLNKNGMGRNPSGSIAIKALRNSSFFNVAKLTLRNARFAAVAENAPSATLHLKVGPHEYEGTVAPVLKSNDKRGTLTFKK